MVGLTVAEAFVKIVNDEFQDSSSSSDSDDEYEIFSSSESSSSYCSDSQIGPRRKLHRITTFMDTVEEYDDQEFKEHFRLNRSTAELIIDMIETEDVLPKHKFGREKISARKAFLLTLWYLCNTETFRQCADRFNCTKSSCHRITTKIVDFLVKKSKDYITMPTGQRRNKIISEFGKLHVIFGVVGAVDGSHVKIKRPASKHHHVYFYRKGDYSVLMQGVSDHQKKFISFFCGEPGSIHDSRLLKKSSIYRTCIAGCLGENFLLGDSAYPCLNWLISPFKDNGRLTQNQKKFNYRHSATRIVIENAFGLLKGRFRRLKYFENDNLKFVVKCIVAAAVLHNICLENQDELDVEETECGNNNEDLIDVTGVSGVTESCFKRDEIFRNMFN